MDDLPRNGRVTLTGRKPVSTCSSPICSSSPDKVFTSRRPGCVVVAGWTLVSAAGALGLASQQPRHLLIAVSMDSASTLVGIHTFVLPCPLSGSVALVTLVLLWEGRITLAERLSYTRILLVQTRPGDIVGYPSPQYPLCGDGGAPDTYGASHELALCTVQNKHAASSTFWTKAPWPLPR